MIYLMLVCFLTNPAMGDHSGFWKGAIELPTSSLDIFVELNAGESGWTGSIDIPGQGLYKFPLSNIESNGDRVLFQMGGVPGEPNFDGTLADGTITGNFQQGPQSFPFSMKTSESGMRPRQLAVVIEPIAGEGVVGEWMGTLETGPLKLRLTLIVTAGEGDTLAATFESLDQNASLPVDTISFEAKHMTFGINRVQAGFAGDMNEDGSALEGNWTQMGNNVPLTFHRVAKAKRVGKP